MWDRQNNIIVRTGFVAPSATTCDIQSGDEGIWNNSGTFKFRHADGSDTEVATVTPMYGPCRLIATSLPNAPAYDTTKLTWTAGSNSTLTVDSVVVNLNDRVLVSAGNANDGIYKCTAAGAGGGGGSKWVLTRVAEMNTSAQFIQGAAVAVFAGTVYANSFWELSFTTPFTMDTTTPVFTQTAGITFTAVQTALNAASSAVGVNGQKITSLANPTANNDAANKSYVDNHLGFAGSNASTVSSGTVQFANSNGLTFGLGGSTITGSFSTLSFANSNGVALGVNGSTVTASLPTVHYFENDLSPNNALFAQTGSGAINMSLQRVSVPYQISATQMDLLGALTVVAQTHCSYTLSAAVYTFNASTLSMASSSSFAVTVNSSVYTNFSGTRYRSMALGTWNLTPGEYYFANMVSCNGPAGTTGSFSFFGQNSVSINGVEGNASNYSAYFGPGIYSAATGAFPAAISRSDINQTGSASTNNPVAQPYFRLLAVGA
jgi:hypothetical protein